MTPTAENIETIFARLCAEHDLTSIEVCYSARFQWSAVSHWTGFSHDGLTCASNNYGPHATAGAALQSMLTVMKAKRNARIVVPALEMECAA